MELPSMSSISAAILSLAIALWCQITEPTEIVHKLKCLEVMLGHRLPSQKASATEETTQCQPDDSW